MTYSSVRLSPRVLAIVVGIFALSSPGLALAEEHFGHHEFHERHVAHFAPHDFAVWRGGYWHHGWMGGRFGWWWFAGGAWYFYDQPVYPYPTEVSELTIVEPAAPPPPVVVQQPPAAAPAAPSYYYCDNPAGYYPTVQTCTMPWRPVPIAPPH
jgi:hypothetical protein